MPPHGGVRDAERPAELGPVPDLTVPVGKHGPEAAQRGRRHGASEAGQVAFEKSADEVVAPAAAGGPGTGDVRPRKAAPQPEPLEVGNLVQVEAAELMERHPPGERFGGLAQQFRRRAAEHEETGRRARAVGQHPQHGEHVGQALDFIEDDEAPQRAQFQAGVGQPGEVLGILEVEPGGRAAARGDELTGEGRLPDLPGAEQRDDGKLSQQQRQPAQVPRAGDVHALEL